MSRYIDATKAMESIDDIVCSMSVCINSDYCNGMRAMKNAVIHAIEKQPTVDAVQVVRCKDCKYKPSWREGVKEEFRDGFELIFPDWRDNPCPCQCDDGFYAHMPDDNWFCANGEEKNDD